MANGIVPAVPVVLLRRFSAIRASLDDRPAWLRAGVRPPGLRVHKLDRGKFSRRSALRSGADRIFVSDRDGDRLQAAGPPAASGWVLRRVVRRGLRRIPDLAGHAAPAAEWLLRQ